MGLFSNPVTLSDDGGTTTDRTFDFRGTLPALKTGYRGGDYLETAAALAAMSMFTIKHDMRTSIIRNLCQRSVRLHPAADTETDDLYLVTFNLTAVASNLFTEAELQPELNLLLDAAEESNFLKGMRAGMV